jgi:Sulfotransferase family
MHIAYFHVPKCSGVTVTEFFSRKFGHESVLTNVTALDYLTTPSTYFSSYKVFAGHITYDCLPLLPTDCSFVTVLRNPHSRLLSLYRYYRGLDPKLHHPQSAVLAKTMDFHDWLECGDPSVINETRSAILRQFVPDSFFRNKGAACPHNMLKAAEDFIGRFLAVGFVEELSISMQILSQAFSLPLSGADMDIRLNVSTDETVIYSRDRLRTFFEEHSWLDLEFLRNCITVFRRQCPVDSRKRLNDLELRIFS